MSGWVEEDYKKGGLNFRLRSEAKLFSKTSPFQKVEIFETTDHGRVLLNDDCFMLSERDERIYHEMMAHVPLSVHPNPRRVLIIGGGDGGTAREVLRHPQVEKCVLVEIDAAVLDACREHIPQTAAVLDHPKLELHVEDGLAFMKNSRETFDVILIDSTDPQGAAEPLFGEEFYRDIAARLGPDGIVVAQGESVFYEAEMQAKLVQLVSAHFQFSSPYNFSNMTYPGGLWSFVWGSRTRHPLKDVRPLPGLEMFYYNSGIHQAAFQLPEFQLKALRPWIKL